MGEEILYRRDYVISVEEGCIFLAGSLVTDHSSIFSMQAQPIFLDMFVPVALFVSAIWFSVGGFA